MRNLNLFLILIFGGLLASSCQNKPQVVEGQPITTEDHNEPMHVIEFPMAKTAEPGSGMHKIVVHEKLDTDRYSYLRVTEDEDEFWLAILRSDVEIGGTYYFTGGLLKKHFHSQEYDKVFETLYLVSDIRKQIVNTGGGSAVDQALNKQQAGSTPARATETTSSKGALKIEDLISDPGKYEGKTIRIAGTCVKVNPMIMGRNWVHIQDGSANNYDLTVTTTEVINQGAIVTLEGTIALNKDFGAGYRYDIIMENAVIK